MEMTTELATFGAGCFWGVEAAFRRIAGVRDTAVGYSGGRTLNPSYKEVCTDRTGHAEVVQVEFDPSVVKYEELLAAFFALHDPTQVNRQGPDLGTQYRSVIFFHSPEQEMQARAMIRRLEEEEAFSEPIATQVLPFDQFWRAEEYHQRYLEKRGLASCHM
jgi:peptide-methionine (S)-S-oxide reductase